MYNVHAHIMSLTGADFAVLLDSLDVLVRLERGNGIVLQLNPIFIYLFFGPDTFGHEQDKFLALLAGCQAILTQTP